MVKPTIIYSEKKRKNIYPRIYAMILFILKTKTKSSMILCISFSEVWPTCFGFFPIIPHPTSPIPFPSLSLFPLHITIVLSVWNIQFNTQWHNQQLLSIFHASEWLCLIRCFLCLCVMSVRWFRNIVLSFWCFSLSLSFVLYRFAEFLFCLYSCYSSFVW